MIFNVILPHHHHHDQVCFTADHCDVDEDHHHDYKHEHNGSEHAHHEGEAEYCQLNDLYLAPQNLNSSWKTKIIKIENLQSVDAIVDIYQSILFHTIKSPENRFIPYQKIKTIKSLSRALRAPPVY